MCERILIIQTAFLGDAVLTLPLIQKLKEKKVFYFWKLILFFRLLIDFEATRQLHFITIKLLDLQYKNVQLTKSSRLVCALTRREKVYQ